MGEFKNGIERIGSTDTSSSTSVVLPALRSGLVVAYKSVTEVYVNVGSIDIEGTLYSLLSRVIVDCSGVGSATTYYLYVKTPSSGTDLTLSEITLTTDTPSWNSSYGYEGHATHGRWIGTFTTDLSGNVPESMDAATEFIQPSSDGIVEIQTTEIVEAKVLTDAGFDSETGDTGKTFVLTTANLTADREATLPVATGSGVRLGFLIESSNDNYFFKITPDQTNPCQILGTETAGDSVWATHTQEHVILS